MNSFTIITHSIRCGVKYCANQMQLTDDQVVMFKKKPEEIRPFIMNANWRVVSFGPVQEQIMCPDCWCQASIEWRDDE